MDCAGIEENAGIVPLPFAITLRVASAPNLLTTLSISGPRSPSNSGPWQTWHVCSWTARPICADVGIPAPPRPAALRGRFGINPPMFAAIDPPAGTSLMIDGMSFDST